MEPIRPLHEDYVKRFCGMPVCAILRDGTRHMGILSACQGGRIYLNGGENYLEPLTPRAGILGKPAKGAKKSKAVKASKPEHKQEQDVHTQAFGPGYYGGGYPYGYGYGYGAAVAVDLAFLAFLFLLI